MRLPKSGRTARDTCRAQPDVELLNGIPEVHCNRKEIELARWTASTWGLDKEIEKQRSGFGRPGKQEASTSKRGEAWLYHTGSDGGCYSRIKGVSSCFQNIRTGLRRQAMAGRNHSISHRLSARRVPGQACCQESPRYGPLRCHRSSRRRQWHRGSLRGDAFWKHR